MKKITRRDLVFLALFGVAALIAAQINFSQILGAENQAFTLFQFFGPTAAAFLGPVLGIGAILSAEIANFALLGKSVTFINIARLFPMLFAAYYFAKGRNLLGIGLPLLCMAAFMFHPIGGQAWLYSLYWLIPVAAAYLPNRLFLRSLGATFTAHAIGSTLWLYTFETTPAFWMMLIPIVAFERLMFASGITVSYVAMNTVLAKLETRFNMRSINIDPRYIIQSRIVSG
ncbi:MAG: hypothetical protein ABIG39_02245 [Candidatus Micrarchaeota archaeon]